MRDIIILLISVFVVWLNLSTFKFKKDASSGRKTISMVLLIIWAVTIFLPNIPVLLWPITPKVYVRVIDAETKRPLPNINVKIGWYYHNYNVGGGIWGGVYRAKSTKTNERGEFTVPRSLKTLSLLVFPLFFEKYGGIEIIAYSYDYAFVKKFTKGKGPEPVEVEIKLIKDAKSYWESILNIYWEGIRNLGSRGENVSKEEKTFFLNAYDYFERRFPNADYAELEDKAYLGQFAVTLDDLKEPNEAIKINRLIIEKYPSSARARWAARNIEQLKEKYHLKTEDNWGGGTK